MQDCGAPLTEMKLIGNYVCGDDNALDIKNIFTLDPEECHDHCLSNSECEWF